MPERGDDPGERVGRLLGLGDDLGSAKRATAQFARRLGDEEGVDPGRVEGRERIGDQRSSGQLGDRLGASEAAAAAAREDRAAGDAQGVRSVAIGEDRDEGRLLGDRPHVDRDHLVLRA
jgi:hypothetical protein